MSTFCLKSANDWLFSCLQDKTSNCSTELTEKTLHDLASSSWDFSRALVLAILKYLQFSNTPCSLLPLSFAHGVPHVTRASSLTHGTGLIRQFALVKRKLTSILQAKVEKHLYTGICCSWELWAYNRKKLALLEDERLRGTETNCPNWSSHIS